MDENLVTQKILNLMGASGEEDQLNNFIFSALQRKEGRITIVIQKNDGLMEPFMLAVSDPEGEVQEAFSTKPSVGTGKLFIPMFIRNYETPLEIKDHILNNIEIWCR